MNKQEAIQGFLKNLDLIGKAALGRTRTIKKGIPTQSQLGVLFAIANNGPQSVKQIAQCFGISSSAATQIVNGLVKDKMLKRTEGQTDRRVTSIALTNKGLKSIELAKQSRYELLKQILEPLSEIELNQLLSIQAKVVNQLQILWKK